MPSKRRRTREYRRHIKPFSIGNQFGKQQGSAIHELEGALKNQFQDEGWEDAISQAFAGIEAAVLICEHYLEVMETRLGEVHRLFTEHDMLTSAQMKFYQREVEKTENVISYVRSFRRRVAHERGRGPRTALDPDTTRRPQSHD